jgi:hypothetical protein
MFAITSPADMGRRPKIGSMSHDRRWALRWSYFFLVPLHSGFDSLSVT